MQYTQRRRFTADFKRLAVQRSLDSHETVAEIAGKLGIHHQTLTRWRAELVANSDKPRVKNRGPQHSAKQLERRISALEKQLERAELENEILKKAQEYFTKNLR